MNGILVRIGVDQAYGKWNAPVDEATHEFVFVPIPDGDGKQYRPGLRVPYDNIRADVRIFAQQKNFPADWEFGFPEALRQHSAHLDPDFRWLTYGDNGAVRGKRISQLTTMLAEMGQHPLTIRDYLRHSNLHVTDRKSVV